MVQEAHFESFDTLSPSPVLHSHHPLQLFQNPGGLFDLKRGQFNSHRLSRNRKLPSFVRPQAPMFWFQPHGAYIVEHWSSTVPCAGIHSVVKLLLTPCVFSLCSCSCLRETELI